MRSGKTEPPRLAVKFLHWFCPHKLFEGIIGDLYERFNQKVMVSGIRTARIDFVIQVIRFFRPGIIIRHNFSYNLINGMLLKSYLKISLRNLLRYKGYSSINIFGLAIGIAACLMSFSYVNFELSYDNFHPDVNLLYRVNETMIWRPEGGIFDSTGPALAQALSDDYPEIEEVLRINTPGSYIIRYTDKAGITKAFNEDNVLAADSNFFDFFGFRLKEGNPGTALKGVDQIVISDMAATKFFGNEPAFGKILELGEDRRPVVVTGVTERQPENAHFHFDYLMSMNTNPNIKKFEWSWIWTQVVTYVKLKAGTNAETLEAKLRNLGERRVKPSCERYGIDYDQIIKGKNGWNFYIQPVRDIHLYSSEIGNRLGPVSDITQIYVFGILGLIVLIIAAINFINLSTARGATRSREVGVKKTMGASRKSLIWQFQTESVLIALIASIAAIFLARMMIILLHVALGFDLPYFDFSDNRIRLILPLLPVIIGFLAGLYPSFYLTAFRPVQILKGRLSSGMGNSVLRNALVALQFTISIGLIAATIIVFQQLRFLQTKNLGFNKENVLVINHAEKLGSHLKSFRDEIEGFSGVEKAAIAMDIPGGGYYEDIWLMEGSNTKLPVTELKVDQSYFDFMDFKLVTGREFDINNPSDKYAAIPNESAVRLFGFTPQEALGRHIIYPGDESSQLEIIGVVKDFNYHSLHEPISPMVLINTDAPVWGDMRVIAVKYAAHSVSRVMAGIERKWNKILDATPIDFSFMDQVLAQQYREENQLGRLLAILTGLSILVALIGLIGLVSYSVEVRKKEIGIRKVFGASITRIIVMLNNQYVRLMAIALIIASPLAWWLLRQWLNSFAFKIHISWIIFILSGIIELTVAVLCVGYLAFRSARTNPAHVLREE